MDWFSTETLSAWVTSERFFAVLRAFLVLGFGALLARLVASGVARVVRARADAQGAMIARRATFYGLLGIVLASTLRELGFELSVLLGAAGVLTVALGFASQTSASNLISGLFLIAERPFVVGDAIRVEDATGEVLSIDLLSVKLRTFDNTLVRVPNEAIIKSRVTNLTHFPIRRMDLEIGVAYREDLERVRRTLVDLAHRDPRIFMEPDPLFIFKGFGASSLDIQFSVWARRENFIHTKTRFLMEVKREFDREGIEIPFPHVSIYTGSETVPFPVRSVATRRSEPGADEGSDDL